ncbi:MAG: sensor histidine kinase [Deltaproteobacteria bacterium]|nr:sensor histidine kinase [Deltaproteobacteria bacterium]
MRCAGSAARPREPPSPAARPTPSACDRLFRADASRGTPGAGLGLAMVRAIVAAHGGTVDVEATGEGGATFAFRLPVAAGTRSA